MLNQEITDPKFKSERGNIGIVWNGSFPFLSFSFEALEAAGTDSAPVVCIFLAWQIHRGVHGFGKQKPLENTTISLIGSAFK